MASIIKSLLLVAVLGLLVFAGHANAGVNTNVITSNATPSPDFDGDNWVGFTDFLIFAQAFGSRQGDGSGRYEAKYDLDGDGEIGFGDFLIFAGSFGKEPPSSGGGDGGSPDLVVQSPSVSNNNVASGATFTLSATVRNEGDGSSAPTTLRYYRSTDKTVSAGDAEVGTDAVDGLAASGASAASINLTAPSDAGTYYYGACVDAVTGESDTRNNCSLGVPTIVEEPDTTPVTIPDADLRGAIEAALGKASGAPITVAEMKTLITLETGYISDPTGLEFATNLRELNLGSSSITELSALAGLTNLTSLTLGCRDLRDLSALKNLPNLTHLILGNNNITDISALSGLSDLTWLNIARNPITDISPLSGLTNLSHLNIQNCDLTSISALSGLTNLTDWLDLAGNNLTDISALSVMNKLTYLDLRDNNLTDISALSGLTSLRTLYIENNEITNISPLSGLPLLGYLDIRANNITDISALSGSTRLWSLLLASNNLEDISPLSGMTQLRRVDLGYNNISDVPSLSDLTYLEELDLKFNNISDISALSSLTNRTYLDLRGNPLSYSSINDHITALQRRGVAVLYDSFREGDFAIELVFLDHFPEPQKSFVHYAARKWMSIITDDLPDYTFAQGWSGECGRLSYEIPSGERIDDLRIYVTADIGESFGRAWGGPSVLRETTHLPVVGCMAFDLELTGLLESGLHEIGHVLGFGPVWSGLGLLQEPDGDTHFNGPLAVAAFDDAGGRNYTGAKVPVETDWSHWRGVDPVLRHQRELMRPSAGKLLTAITVQSLADLGYGVDVTQADPYFLRSAAAKAVAKIAAAVPSIPGVDVTQPGAYALPDADLHWQESIARFPRAELWCGAGLRREPIYVVDPQGRISHTISSD